ncbi:MAG TPA: hypothetical protein VGP93_04315, partial [Polyangiaceae bacterium]|nr:hypothetical protein [Polyangiaceae bacterium]
MSRCFAIACFTGLLFSALPSWADPSPTELAVARRLFNEATELEGKSDFRAARAKLSEAIGIKETAGLRFHLGYCSEQLGELVAALVEYDRALDLVHGGAKAPDVEKALEPAKQRVQARVAQLTLTLPSDVPFAEVELDGQKLAPSVLGHPAPLDPGKHRVEARAPGRKRTELELSLKEGEQRTVELSLLAQAPAPKTGAPAPEATPARPTSGAGSRERNGVEQDSGARGVGAREFVLIGETTVALAGLGVGIGYLIARSHARDRVTTAQQQ